MRADFIKRLRKWLTILNIIVSSLTWDNFYGIDSYTVFFWEYDDLLIFVVGNSNDNELIISEVLNTLHECFDSIFPRGINRKNLTDNMLPVIMIFDELIDEGIIMTTETDLIIERINEKKGSKVITAEVKTPSTKEEPPSTGSGGGGYSFSSVFASAKNSLAKTLAL